ncbi:hypothetical protein KPH14_010221 [Odynerus spinipes]|uniref:Uncharacterized protein n=1 Tax=Odynerus spinipes TaxID=1348599 RepID=A0AAD9RTD9_9HYME|nr:hypothetical protein KPH14_010221 [Odynerus spinipes]
MEPVYIIKEKEKKRKMNRIPEESASRSSVIELSHSVRLGQAPVWVRVGQLRSIGRAYSKLRFTGWVLVCWGGDAMRRETRNARGKAWSNRNLTLYNYNANSAYTAYG